MAVRQVTLYGCDYCGLTTERPTKLWFVVNSQEYACEMCGHGIMDVLSKLSVPYQKVCNKYSPDSYYGTALGTISFDPGSVVATTQVILLAAKAFRRSG